jgi:hypothetical protein
MTYQDDRDKHIVYEADSSISWMLGGLVVLALVAGLIFFFSPDANTNTASNMERANPAAAPSATPPLRETTGSGAGTPPTPSPSPNR